MKKILHTLRWLLLIEIVNVLLIQFLEQTTALLIISWSVTISIIFWGGWLIIKTEWGTLARAAFVGPIILICFMLIGGLYNLATGDFSDLAKPKKIDINPRILYVGGVVISTIMVVPIAALISLIGGILGRKYIRKLRMK